MLSFLFYFFLLSMISSKALIPPCDHPIYCQGELLDTIQMSSIFNDSKTFVDMPSKFHPDLILEKFKNLSNFSISSLKEFISDNFLPAGSEIIAKVPEDWHPNPEFLTKIENKELRNWANDIHAIWLDLNRMTDHNISCPACFSSIPSPKPFIVPGGRFREYYYWDNLWIIQGLLISEMPETSLNIIENLLDMIDKYGFVWNGARIYYSKRTQPPVVSLMVYDVYHELIKTNTSKGMELLNRSYALLIKEYNYWMTEKKCQILGISLENLNCYRGFAEFPRPESYKEDKILSENVKKLNTSVFREIIAGAETGWDFTSRFFEDFQNMTTINVSRVIPVDLNAILYKVEVTLSEISMILDKKHEEKHYKKQSQRRKKLIMEILFDREKNQWMDANIENLAKNDKFYLSNFIPLWAFDNLNDQMLEKIVRKLDEIQKIFPGGVPTSLINSTQQWDFPNVWPPLQDFLIFGLWSKKNQESRKLALELAQKYINNAFCGWMDMKQKRGKGAMFEKYNAVNVGGSGHGGEYEVQEGFGWSNGVALKILKEFGGILRKPECGGKVGE